MNGIGYGNSMFLATHGILARSGGGGASLLLDTYTGAAVAYSLRKLRTAYTGAAIRVRRSSDNAEQDINFVGGDLDTASLLTFCGAGNGFVTTWYDQSGNANNATQATAASQCQIVSSGAVITDPITSKLSSLWSADAYLLSSSFAPVQQHTQVAVFNRIDNTSRYINLGAAVSSPYIGYWFPTGNNVNTSYGSTFQHGIDSSTGIYIQTVLRNSSNEVKAWHNNVAFSTIINSQTSGTFTYWGRSSSPQSSGYKQELIYWEIDQDANRTGIETNANTYWNAY